MALERCRKQVLFRAIVLASAAVVVCLSLWLLLSPGQTRSAQKDKESRTLAEPARHLASTAEEPTQEGSTGFPDLSAQTDVAHRVRSAAERVNSRLDVSYGFDRHFIRGQAKMRLRCSLAMVVMLAMALGRVRERKGQEDAEAPTVRSLVRTA